MDEYLYSKIFSFDPTEIYRRSIERCASFLLVLLRKSFNFELFFPIKVLDKSVELVGLLLLIVISVCSHSFFFCSSRSTDLSFQLELSPISFKRKTWVWWSIYWLVSFWIFPLLLLVQSIPITLDKNRQMTVGRRQRRRRKKRRQHKFLRYTKNNVYMHDCDEW